MRAIKSVLVHGNLVEYFRELVSSSVRNNQLEIEEIVEFYLVQLLADFQKSERMTQRCPKTGDEEPFAITYLRALQSQPNERFALMKALGDRSLYLTGVFADHFEESSVGLDYYMSLGGNAYTAVASSVGRLNADLSELFRDLSENFESCTQILAEVSDSAGFRRDSDLLKVYERWLRTGSERAAKTLNRAGIPLVEIDPDDPENLQ